MGGKTRTGSDGEVAKGWDHDPPAKEKLTPFGILMVASGALMLLFGSESVNDSLFVGLSIALALGRYVTPFRGDLASFSPDHA